jgi:hypothetical protein
LNKNGASDYKIKINIESCISRFAKWSDVDINPLLYEKENEEKIWKRLGENLEIQNKISRGKRKESIFYRQPRERRINSRDRIWKRFGDTKQNSRELERQ